MSVVGIERKIDPFFIDAVNSVYKNPKKKAFIMDGPIGVGKSTNFTFEAPYDVAMHVKPVNENGRMVRRSRWAIARESENSAVNTLFEIFEMSRFPPEVLYAHDSPVQKRGINPTIIDVSHELNDETFLEMSIECYGFRDEKSFGRLKSRSFLGAMAPELQTMPFDILELLIERCGGRSAPGMIVQKEIDGRMYTLSGADPLTMVFCDMNIPTRPHDVYDYIYDERDINDSQYMMITPPSPVKPIPIENADIQDLEEFPITEFDGQKVVWIPNESVYWMTSHYERAQLDEHGNIIEDVHGNVEKVMWSGYDYWLSKVGNGDSYVRRLILGLPDKIGGIAAVYKNFNQLKSDVKEGYKPGLEVYAGVDPGLFAGWVFFQLVRREGKKYLHAFKEFVFAPEDGLTSRQQFEEFVLPYINDKIKKTNVTFTGDPYIMVKTAKGDGEAVILREHSIRVKSCDVANQHTEARISRLGWFIEKGMLTINRDECPMFWRGMSGAYQFPVSSQGKIGTKPLKNDVGHVVEAAQYVAANIYRMVKKDERKGSRKGGAGKIRKLIGR